ncbi:MAG: hypothetical protein WC789_07375 [Lentisphaeria bacterium]|jgi:hypothetical protein
MRHPSPSPSLADLRLHAAIAAAAGIAVALLFPRQAPDTERFLATARNLAENGIFSLDGATPSVRDFPLLPWLLALARKVGGGDGQAALRILNGLCLGATALAVARGTALLLDERQPHLPGTGFAPPWLPPLLALWGTALWPTQLGSTLFVLTEPLFTALFLWANLLLATEIGAAAAAGPRPGRWALAGTIFGLASLTRSLALPYAALALPLAAGLAWWQQRRRRGGAANGNAIAGLRAGALAGLMLLCIVGPWSWRNYRVTDGRFIPVSVGEGLGLAVGAAQEWRGEYPDDLDPRDPLMAGKGLTLAAADAELKRQAWATIKADPAAWLRLAPLKLKRLWLDVPGGKRQIRSGWLVATLAALNLGLLAAAAAGYWLGRRRLLTGWFLLPPLYFSAVHTLLFGMARFRIPAEPFLILAAAAAGGRLLATAAQRGKQDRPNPPDRSDQTDRTDQPDPP